MVTYACILNIQEIEVGDSQSKQAIAGELYPQPRLFDE